MATTEVWVIAIAGIISAIIAGYLIITRILPKIKNALDLSIKDNLATEGLMLIFFIYVILFVIRKALEVLTTTQEPWVKYIPVVKPGIDVLTDLLPYLGIFMIAVTVAVAITRASKK